MWKLVFARDAVSGPSASGGEGPVWRADAGPMPAAHFCPSAQLPALRSVIPPAASGRNQFRPGGSRAPIFCVSQTKTVSRRSFPALMPCPQLPVTVCLLAVTESPGQGGGRTQARGGWERAARKAANDCQSTKSVVLTSEVLPSAGTQLEAPLGSSMTDTPGITPARCRENEAHPSRSGFLPSGPSSLGPRAPAAGQPPPATAVPCQHFHLENKPQ